MYLLFSLGGISNTTYQTIAVAYMRRGHDKMKYLTKIGIIDKILRVNRLTRAAH